ncbi:serine O-acetyltransferase [Eisenibacter elegans]|jgi:serine O-acetyltransferase|uniref:serine O-acetyltransferase n=1 Tax=Eisenibacter elegans TaxID=997 RepID=UPI000400A7C6|nr:serine O-acetyltransferase [Eisenibacter elegans]
MMQASFFEKISKAHQTPKTLPGVAAIDTFVEMLMQFLFPDLSEQRLQNPLAIHTRYQQLQLHFEQLLLHTEACPNHAERTLTNCFFERLEAVYDACLEDSEAILAGDPAAIDQKEVIRAYPGFWAIAVYRVAHLMWELKIPYLPRIFTEYAHARTGIEIHPAATIGRRFCIDHGTGIVIGETTHIGDDVKIYQGVTLGALSVSKAMAQQKRHPSIGDRVVIYAGATILGGETFIGHDSIIGGNVWLTNSVAPHSRVYYSSKGQQVLSSQED